MANRRMFSRDILESDAFLDLPNDAKTLYIYLNMNSDDDGFCDNPRSIMRMCGATDDSMKLLIAKKFVLSFSKSDNFIVVIKHWRINNFIRNDRYNETKYKELMKEMYYDENKAYSLNPNDGHKPCIKSLDTNGIPTVSTGKDRLVKDSQELVKESLLLDKQIDKSERADTVGKDVSTYLSKKEELLSKKASCEAKGFTSLADAYEERIRELDNLYNKE